MARKQNSIQGQKVCVKGLDQKMAIISASPMGINASCKVSFKSGQSLWALTLK